MRLPLDTSARAEPSATARLVNVQAEAMPPGERAPARIMRAPGVRPYWQGNGPGRGLHAVGETLYSVQGASLYAGQARVGSIPGSGAVQMADNGQELFIAAGGRGYIYDGTLAEITDPDFPGAASVGFLDGYFVFTEPNSGRVWTTALYDGASVDGLAFATAEGSPDNIVAMIVDHRETILFGATTVERWYNVGTNGFPLERSPQGFSEIGCLGGVAKLDNSVFWIANDHTVRRLTGSTPMRVSTHAIEGRLRTERAVRAFAYSLDGHLVYCVTTDKATYCFDATTGMWHERQSYPGDPWRVSAAVNIGGTVYVQDARSGAIGVLDPAVETEWGDTLPASWTYPVVADPSRRRLFHVKLELTCEAGRGGKIVLEYSNDGGRVFHALPAKSLGAVGEYGRRVRWHRLGSASERVYRMTVSDPVPVNVIATDLEVV